MFKNLYQYRELLKTNVQKEIRGKYKGSFLGVLWSFLNPLLMVLVYAIVFPYIMRTNIDNYLVYLITGVIPWNFFTTCITTGCNCVWINGGIIKKVYFPREILPISVVTAGFINFLISCVIILLFVLFSGIGFSFNILFLPLIVLTQFILQQAIIFITSAIDIYIRDAEYIINFFVSMLFYATPILYSPTLFVGTKLEFLMHINPMAVIITSYRDIFYYQQTPDLLSLCIVLAISCVLCYVGWRIFKRLERGFAEEV